MNTKQLLATVEEFGNPLYVYDAQKITTQYNRLTKAFKKVERLRIHYAVKSLSNISVLQHMKTLGACLDTVSIQEVQIGLRAGFPANEIIFTPNGVSLQEIEEVAAMGVQINIDNLSILEQFGACLLYTSPSPRDATLSRMPSSA